MPYLLFLKKWQNFKLSSAVNYRRRFKGKVFYSIQEGHYSQSLSRKHTIFGPISALCINISKFYYPI